MKKGERYKVFNLDLRGDTTLEGIGTLVRRDRNYKRSFENGCTYQRWYVSFGDEGTWSRWICEGDIVS